MGKGKGKRERGKAGPFAIGDLSLFRSKPGWCRRSQRGDVSMDPGDRSAGPGPRPPPRGPAQNRRWRRRSEAAIRFRRGPTGDVVTLVSGSTLVVVANESAGRYGAARCPEDDRSECSRPSRLLKTQPEGTRRKEEGKVIEFFPSAFALLPLAGCFFQQPARSPGGDAAGCWLDPAETRPRHVRSGRVGSKGIEY
jgi:hypothetical protein